MRLRSGVARWRASGPAVLDVAVAAVVAVPLAVPFVTGPRDVTPLGVLFNVATVVPLVWRRRAPFAVAVVVLVAGALVSWHHRPGQMLQYAALVAVYTVADLGRPGHRRAVLAAILVTFPPAALLVKRSSAAEFMLTVLLPLTAYLVGTLVRTSRDRAAELERARAADTARARAEERTRIARDMHDVLAHAVSVMVVQAEAGPLVVRADPDRAERTFDVIAEAGRSAMVQLAGTLGVLSVDDDPLSSRTPPSVETIADLVEQVRRAGLPVELRTAGAPREVAADTGVAAYRIVQEALTNALRHAAAASVEVRLEWGDALAITVTDDGGAAGVRGDALPVGGRGLDGMRARADACGGHVEAGPTVSGFRVYAQLPVATVRT